MGLSLSYSLNQYSTSYLESHNVRAEIAGHIAFSKQRGAGNWVGLRYFKAHLKVTHFKQLMPTSRSTAFGEPAFILGPMGPF